MLLTPTPEIEPGAQIGRASMLVSNRGEEEVGELLGAVLTGGGHHGRQGDGLTADVNRQSGRTSRIRTFRKLAQIAHPFSIENIP